VTGWNCARVANDVVAVGLMRVVSSARLKMVRVADMYVMVREYIQERRGCSSKGCSEDRLFLEGLDA